MKIEFKRIGREAREFSLVSDGLLMQGKVFRDKENLYLIEALLEGSLEVVCDVSGEVYLKPIREDLLLRVSDGFFSPSREGDGPIDDVIECFDGFLDLDEILAGEVALISSGYHRRDEDLG